MARPKKSDQPATERLGLDPYAPISLNELCRLINISRPRADRLVRDGAPIERGHTTLGHRVVLCKFVAFMIEDAIRQTRAKIAPTESAMSLEEARRKDKEVQAAIRELELRKRQGTMIDVNDVRPVLREVFAITRSRLLSIETQVTGLTQQQQRQLEDALNDALGELVEFKLENVTTTPSDVMFDDDEAPSEISQH